jgi:tetratricopeptide (TPR) repeat protein
MASEWYQRPEWDEKAQADFRLRLSRARDQRLYYLGQKAGAIAINHPEAALALYDEKIAAAEYEDEIVPALHAQAMIHFRTGDYEAMFERFERAIETGGEFTAIAAITDYCSAVGLLRDESRYARALDWLDRLDRRALAQLGHPFVGFAASAARAFICWQTGERAKAADAAREALEMSVSDDVVPGLPCIGSAPRPPSPIHDRLLVIAGMWDEAELGPAPEA